MTADRFAGPIIRSGFPRAGSPTGDQVRDAYIANFLDICKYDSALWLPGLSDTTTSTDVSKNALVFTYDATIAARISTLGSMISVDFDGTDDEADTPDVNLLSFGDAAIDSPFSLVVLCKPDVNNAAMTLIAKENSATAEEWNMRLNASGHLVVTLTDESASATIIGTYATAVGTSRVQLGMTYTGSMASSGITNYVNGAKVTTAASGSGTYVAMENTAALVHLFSRYTTKEEFFNGGGEMAAIVLGALSAEQHWRLKQLNNSVFDLSL
jgi:hypothetical protein